MDIVFEEIAFCRIVQSCNGVRAWVRDRDGRHTTGYDFTDALIQFRAAVIFKLVQDKANQEPVQIFQSVLLLQI
jgi:hypothetical protein